MLMQQQQDEEAMRVTRQMGGKVRKNSGGRVRNSSGGRNQKAYNSEQ